MRVLMKQSFVLVLILLWGAMLASAQSVAHADARNLIARVQNDLQRASDFARSGNAIIKKDEKQIARYRNAQRSASNFDRQLSKGKFDKGGLDSVINDLKNVVEHNTLQSQDRDALTIDLRDLRDLRSRH